MIFVSSIRAQTGAAAEQVLTEADPPRDPSALRRYLMRTAWYQRTKISGEGPCAPDLHDCSASTRRNIRSMFGSDILTLLRYPYTPPALRQAHGDGP